MSGTWPQRHVDLRSKLPQPFNLTHIRDLIDKDTDGIVLSPEQMDELYTLLQEENVRRVEAGEEVRIGRWKGMRITSDESALEA